MGCLGTDGLPGQRNGIGGIVHRQREKAGLENIQHHDTEAPIRAAIEALRELIKADQKQSV